MIKNRAIIDSRDVYLILITALLFFLFVENIFAQRTRILNNRIATPQIAIGNDWQSLPILSLKKNIPINISFDDLTHQYRRYAYRIEHLDAFWNVSKDIFTSDYISGFSDENLIDDITESVNTNVLYTHYAFSIPNDRCSIKMSGNYKVSIYDTDNNDEVVLECYFMVVDDRMGIKLLATSNTDKDINGRHQQVEVSLNYNNIRVQDFSRQIKVVILQNGRFDNAVMLGKPSFVLSNGLKWTHDSSLIFDAGNEYRKFELLDVRHAGLGVESIEWDNNRYNAYLWISEPRNSYVYDEDANGAFYIRNSDNEGNDYLSDYVKVHFILKTDKTSDDIYVNGKWTSDLFLPQYKMNYDDEDGLYKVNLLLKQGYYSYQYLLLNNSGKVSFVNSEGNFYQTENKYQVLVYYRGLQDRTDHLVGYSEVQIK